MISCAQNPQYKYHKWARKCLRVPQSCKLNIDNINSAHAKCLPKPEIDIAKSILLNHFDHCVNEEQAQILYIHADLMIDYLDRVDLGNPGKQQYDTWARTSARPIAKLILDNHRHNKEIVKQAQLLYTQAELYSKKKVSKENF